MPVIKPSEADNYKPVSDFSFLSLPNDKDIARVRFYIESLDDVKMYVVHEIYNRQGKKRYVNCLRTYDMPIDDCPLCRESLTNKDYKTKIKLFLPVYDVTDPKNKQVKIFERGRDFYKELEGVIRRNSPLTNYPCEIERNGEKGSTDTVYKVYPLAQEKDDTLIKDLPEAPELLNGYILELTIEEMEEFIRTGNLPNTNTEKAEDKELPRRTHRSEEKAEETSRTSNTRKASRF